MKQYFVATLLAALVVSSGLAQETGEQQGEPAQIDIAAELRALDGELPDYLQDDEVAAAQFLAQPSLAVPSESPSAESPRPVRRSGRSEYVRLARVPNMLGDSIGTGGQIAADNVASGPFFSDLPLGAARSVKIAENNKGLPMDRVYFMYNGFKNAFTTQAGGNVQDFNLDRYTLGGEKTFYDGMTSIDLRMPFIGSFLAGDRGTFPASVSQQNVGDLSMTFKALLYGDDFVSMGGGMGLTLPTASDLRGVSDSQQPFRLKNQAVHLLPYFGMVVSPGDAWFFQAYLQFDFAASGFQVQVPGQPNGGTLTEQNLMYMDCLAGRWLYVNESAPYLQGIAALFELHYTTTLQDADLVPLVIPSQGQTFGAILGNQGNRVDYFNITAGLQFQLSQLSNLRVSCVIPLKQSGFNRQFDSEVVVSFNRNF